MRQVQLDVDGLEIRAPISGIISAIHSWPGQAVQRGEPVVTIAADHGRYVVGYVRQENNLTVRDEMAVQIRPRGDVNTKFVTTKVERVGPQFEPVPEHQLMDPTRAEWGLPIRIAIPAELDLHPGSLVDIRIPRS